jgi:hypothetical protein
MRWLVVDLVLVVGASGALGLTGLRVWGKLRTVRAEAGELRERVSVLSAETTALSTRLDAAEVSARLAAR